MLERDQQRRADRELGERAGFHALLVARRGRIAQFREPQMLAAPVEPRQRLDRGAAQGLGMALREVAARGQHRFEILAAAVEEDRERRVRRGGLAQRLEAAGDGVIGALAA